MAETVATGMSQSDRFHAVTASFLGWTLDAFDFFVVVFLYDVLAAEFHVSKTLIVATVTATLATRPLGALIFGSGGRSLRTPHSADGRRDLLFHRGSALRILREFHHVPGAANFVRNWDGRRMGRRGFTGDGKRAAFACGESFRASCKVDIRSDICWLRSRRG